MELTKRSNLRSAETAGNVDTEKSEKKIRVFLKKKLPILEWLPKYDRLTALSDLIAGITLGLTLVPQSIAYASLAGLQVHYGLYSAFIGTMLYVIFGTIKEVSIGPTSLMALIVFQTCKGLPIEYVVLLTFLSGCVVMALGLLRLGFLVDLISAPVTSGFTSATAIIIVFSQLKGLLGLKFKAETVIENVMLIYENVQSIKTGDIILSVNCIALLLILRKLKDLPAKHSEVKKVLWIVSISRNAIVVFATSLIAFCLHSSNPKKVPVSLSGLVEPGLPRLSFPSFSLKNGNETISFLSMCSTLGPAIVMTPIVMVLANIAIAKAFSSGRQIDATQEMLTLGLCNIVGSVFHSMPTCGAFTRSAVSNASGVRTPMAGLYSGSITLLALIFLTKYFYFIPKATLSSVLICSVIFMVDLKIIFRLWKQSKPDWFLLMMTLVLSILKSVEVALFVGMLVNVTFLLYSWARPNIVITKLKAPKGGEYIQVLPGMGLFYLNIDYFCARVTSAAAGEGESILPIVIDFSQLQSIDYSACQGLEQLHKKFKNTVQKLILFNASEDVTRKLSYMNSIDVRHLRSHSESDISEDLTLSNIEALKREAVPLLAEVFIQRGTICENTAKFEIDKPTKENDVTVIKLETHNEDSEK